MSTNTTHTVTPALVRAIETTWSAIRANHPDVPEVVVTLGAGSVKQGLKLGHFAAHRWVRGEETISELFVGGEGLARGAEDVLGTLLHEAAHAAADTRGIKDTSRQGRYHNASYKEVGEEFGLVLEQDPTIGWSTTSVPEATSKKYAPQVRALKAAMTAYRTLPMSTLSGILGGKGGDKLPSNGTGADDQPKSNNYVAAVCGCGRRIRVAASILAAAPITCGACGEEFAQKI